MKKPKIRVSLYLPEGAKDYLKSIAQSQRMSLNEAAELCIKYAAYNDLQIKALRKAESITIIPKDGEAATFAEIGAYTNTQGVEMRVLAAVLNLRAADLARLDYIAEKTEEATGRPMTRAEAYHAAATMKIKELEADIRKAERKQERKGEDGKGQA